MHINSNFASEFLCVACAKEVLTIAKSTGGKTHDRLMGNHDFHTLAAVECSFFNKQLLLYMDKCTAMIIIMSRV